MSKLSIDWCGAAGSLVAVGDPTALEVIRRQLNLDAVTWKDTDVVHAHLSGDVSENFVAVLEFYPEHCIRERFDDLPFQDDCIFLGLRQGDSSLVATWLLRPQRLEAPDDRLKASDAP